MSFNDFNNKYKLKNEATSNIKIYQVLLSLPLSDVGIYLRDGSFKVDIGTLNLHPTKSTHWVFYIYECYFDLYGITPPKKLSRVIIKQSGYCLCSE